MKDYGPLTEAECGYASNPMTHLGFLFFNRMDKSPLLVVEVDGTSFRADGSAEEARITEKLREILNGKQNDLLK